MSELNRRMSALDAAFLYLERPNTLLHVGGIYTFGETICLDELIADVERRLGLIPRYTQLAVTVPFNLGHPTWESAPDFDITNHIHEHVLENGDDAALARLCSKLFARPLDRSKPLWEMHLIRGYRNGCALLAMTHHCMIDGASGMQLINLLMDPSPKPPPLDVPALPLPSELPSPFAQALDGLFDATRAQVDAGKQLARSARSPANALRQARATLEAGAALARQMLSPAPSTPFNGTLSERRAIAWVPMSLNEVKAIKNRFGGTVNDVILCLISGGLGRYLRSHGVETEALELKAMVPVNVRSEGERRNLGNRVSSLVAPLPVGITDPVERLRTVSAQMEVLKASGQAAQLDQMMAIADIVPPILQSTIGSLQHLVIPVNTVCTNVPGPREARYMLGKRVELMIPVVPLAAGIGLGFAIVSYSDQITIGLNADAEQVRHPWKVAEALEHAFEEMWKVTGLERVHHKKRIDSALRRRHRREALRKGLPAREEADAAVERRADSSDS
jgi:WS/DGAT/MGAT family acyltransferase